MRRPRTEWHKADSLVCMMAVDGGDTGCVKVWLNVVFVENKLRELEHSLQDLVEDLQSNISQASTHDALYRRSYLQSSKALQRQPFDATSRHVTWRSAAASSKQVTMAFINVALKSGSKVIAD